MTTRLTTLLPPLAAIALLAVTPLACAQKSATQQQASDRSELSLEQQEERAAVERRQKDERSALTADHQRDDLETTMKNEMDQGRYTIAAREQLARLDARVAELRRLGHTVDPGTITARDSVAAHIETVENEVMDREVWTTHRDGINSELKAMDDQLDRIANNGR